MHRLAAACTLLFSFGLFFFLPTTALAQEGRSDPDSACILCHLDNDAVLPLPSGELIQAHVDFSVLEQSVHGMHAAENVQCTDCHRNGQSYQYPHAPNPAQDLAEFTGQIAGTCTRCHADSALHNPGHEGVTDNPNVPTCVDCHGGHATEPTDAMAAAPVATCQSCHGDFDDAEQQALHLEVVANFQPGQDCQSCHNNEPLHPPDRECKTCHTLVESEITLASGETLNANVDLVTLASSVHGDFLTEEHGYSPLLCTDCHKDDAFTAFPHDVDLPDDQRSVVIAASAICEDCHTDIADHQADSVHATALAEGNLEAATCIDCHGAHDVQQPDEPRERIEQTCGSCHSTIQGQYEHSVHGAALLGDENPDVPVCTDCHGVHDINDPLTAAFRLDSPQMCGECHANEEMMAKYDISTDVFETYVADFHGQTVELFKKTSPEQETNKAVCYDCHGVHNILPASDEHSQVIRANLLTTCQQCHPDATDNFPDTWTSHFKPSWQHNRLVFLVDWFYQLLIPGLIGGFVLFIGTDIFRRFRGPRKEDK